MQRTAFVILLGGLLLGFGAPRASAATEQPLDETQTQVIKQRFARDPELKNNQIQVTVRGDSATLRGVVDSDQEKTRSGRLALTGTVRTVDNELEVGSVGTENAISDSALTAQIKTRYMAEWGLRK